MMPPVLGLHTLKSDLNGHVRSQHLPSPLDPVNTPTSDPDAASTSSVTQPSGDHAPTPNDRRHPDDVRGLQALAQQLAAIQRDITCLVNSDLERITEMRDISEENAGQSTEMRDLCQEFAEQRSDFRALFQVIAEQRAEIKALSEEVAEQKSKVKTLSEQRLEIKDRSQSITEHSAEVKALFEQGSEIKNLSQNIAEQRAEVKAVSRYAAQQRDEVRTLSQYATEQSKGIQTLSQEIAKLQTQHEEAQVKSLATVEQLATAVQKLREDRMTDSSRQAAMAQKSLNIIQHKLPALSQIQHRRRFAERLDRILDDGSQSWRRESASPVTHSDE